MPPKVYKISQKNNVGENEFKRRFQQHFYDPSFDPEKAIIEKLQDIAWQNHRQASKAPLRRKAGPEFSDPEYELSLEWLDDRQKILDAEKIQRDPHSPSRILLICASPRNAHTCPGESSKTYRLVEMAKQVIEATPNFSYDLLDLSLLTSEYEKNIYPCKSCVSTAMPLCHWPCSCYPNHSLGQVNDWMSEIYPLWVGAHGVMIITPVHWYQAPSVLKLMIDRLVCADGGNDDPTSTGGKNALKAKELELTGWPYPKHLAGRAFSLVVHGDAAGVGALKSALSNWLTDMHLISAGALDRYIGYLKPYATSHEDLDADTALHQEVRNAAQSLIDIIPKIRLGELPVKDSSHDPRPK